MNCHRCGIRRRMARKADREHRRLGACPLNEICLWADSVENPTERLCKGVRDEGEPVSMR